MELLGGFEKKEISNRARKPLQHAEAKSVLHGASVESIETGAGVAAPESCKTTKPRRRRRKRSQAHRTEIKPEELLTADITNNAENQARARLIRLRHPKRLGAADFLDCPDKCPSVSSPLIRAKEYTNREYSVNCLVLVRCLL